MKKISIVAMALFVLSTGGVFAQTAAKSVYAEFGGPGIASINFDTRFTKNQNGLGMRVGFGGFVVDGDGAVFLPVGLNYLLGKESKHYFEVGAGITPIITTGNATSGDGLFESTFGHLNLGYRMQPLKSGFIFRASINPIFAKGLFWPIYGGVSVGYKF